MLKVKYFTIQLFSRKIITKLFITSTLIIKVLSSPFGAFFKTMRIKRFLLAMFILTKA